MSICKPRQTKLCGRSREECGICYTRSLASYLDEHSLWNCWIQKKNIGTSPLLITRQCNVGYWFKCKKCSHPYNTNPSAFLKTIGCRYCKTTGGLASVCNDLECASCFERSLASEVSSELWIPELNNCDPRYIMKHSSTYIWIKCKRCKHKVYTSPATYISQEGCRYCKVNGGLVSICDDLSCSVCKQNRFSSYMNKEYLLNADADIVIKGSNNTYTFKCKRCQHEYSTSPSTYLITDGCKYCCTGTGANVCGKEECMQCYNNSFASSPMSKYWDYSSNSNIRPIDIRISSGKSFGFICPYCENKYVAEISNIRQGHWCKCSKNKTEAKLREFLSLTYPLLEIVSQYVILSISSRKYDIFIPSLNLIIELDGQQHFTQVSNWASPSKTQKVDTLKVIHALKQGYTIIRISQEDVWNDRLIDGISWQERIQKEIHAHDTPSIIYLSSDPTLYDNHKTLWRRGNNLIHMKEGVKNNSTDNLKYFIYKICKPYKQEDESLLIPRSKDIDELDKSVSKVYKLSPIPDQEYSGIYQFLMCILGINVEMSIQEGYIHIGMDREDSLYHLLLA